MEIVSEPDIRSASEAVDYLKKIHQIITYLEDNLIETSGIHAQLGLRFKVLVADVHVNFRYNIAEDVYKGQDSFTEIQFKAGFGF